jgi:VanZ family protein
MLFEFVRQILERPLPWQRRLAWLSLVSLIVALFYFGSRPSAGGLFPSGWDKLIHLLFFGGIAALAFVGSGSRRPLLSVFLVAVLGLLDEVGQSFNPARVASVADWTMDVLGAGLAVIALKTIAAKLRTYRKQ